MNIICAKCSKADPQISKGCERPDCEWRIEAINDIVAKGGEIHVVCDTTNNSKQSIADGYLNVRLEVWPKIEGHA